MFIYSVTKYNFIMSYIFWDITPCSPLKVNRRFGITFRLHPPFAFTTRGVDVCVRLFCVCVGSGLATG
jgi:hypothetical protein